MIWGYPYFWKHPCLYFPRNWQQEKYPWSKHAWISCFSVGKSHYLTWKRQDLVCFNDSGFETKMDRCDWTHAANKKKQTIFKNQVNHAKVTHICIHIITYVCVCVSIIGTVLVMQMYRPCCIFTAFSRQKNEEVSGMSMVKTPQSCLTEAKMPMQVSCPTFPPAKWHLRK